MSYTLIGIAVFVVLTVFLCWRESRIRKNIWAQRRIQGAKAKGMTLEEYEIWLYPTTRGVSDE